jgi:hypothetical protein
VRNLCTLAVAFVALLVCVEGLAAEKKVETPPPSFKDFKLDSLDTKPASDKPKSTDTDKPKATEADKPKPADTDKPKATEADKPKSSGADKPADKAGQPTPPGAKPKRELDVSKMYFDAESIRTVFNFHMPEVQECYEKVLADTGKKLEGKVVVGLIIDANGNVTEARVLSKKSTLKDDRVHECVVQVKGWAFPKAGDNRDHPIEYPFNLKVAQ